MITVRHSCGLIGEYASLAAAIADIREIYGRDVHVDAARSLIWTPSEGMPVAEMYVREVRVVR